MTVLRGTLWYFSISVGWCYGQVDQPSKIKKIFFCSIAL